MFVKSYIDPPLIKRELCSGFCRNFSLRCKADRVSSESGAEVRGRGVCGNAVILGEEVHQQSERQMERQRTGESGKLTQTTTVPGL